MMAYRQASAGRQRACVIGGVLLVQGLATWALLSGLAVRYVPDAAVMFQARNDALEPPPPSPSPSPEARREPVHATIGAMKPIVPAAHPADPQPFATFPLGAGPGDMPSLGPSAGPSISPLAQPSPTPSFAPLGARAIGDAARWLSDNDYPASELRAGHEGAARFRLAIGADGRVTGCTIVTSTGFAGLDTATCNTVSRRARFAPARDGTGAAVAGSYTGGVRWVIPQD